MRNTVYLVHYSAERSESVAGETVESLPADQSPARWRWRAADTQSTSGQTAAAGVTVVVRGDRVGDCRRGRGWSALTSDLSLLQGCERGQAALEIILTHDVLTGDS